MRRGGAIARGNREGGGAAFNDRSDQKIRSPCVRARVADARVATASIDRSMKILLWRTRDLTRANRC
jgi:hypothetical protein